MDPRNRFISSERTPPSSNKVLNVVTRVVRISSFVAIADLVFNKQCLKIDKNQYVAAKLPQRTLHFYSPLTRISYLLYGKKTIAPVPA